MTYRLHLKNKKRFFSLVALLGFVLILFATVISAGATTVPEAQTELLIVHSGDTLWELASTHCGGEDIRSYIDDVKEINQLENGSIYSGQKLLLPVR